MLTYNGFTSSERARVGRQQAEAIRSGSFPAPTQCELCLTTTGQMQLHNEDYSRPFADAHPICRTCHFALHARFTYPARWERRTDHIRQVRAALGVHPANPWWEELGLVPIDINPKNTNA
jgi:hypothetical protein